MQDCLTPFLGEEKGFLDAVYQAQREQQRLVGWQGERLGCYQPISGLSRKLMCSFPIEPTLAETIILTALTRERDMRWMFFSWQEAQGLQKEQKVPSLSDHAPLFHYVSFDTFSGVLLASESQQMGTARSVMECQVSPHPACLLASFTFLSSRSVVSDRFC